MTAGLAIEPVALGGPIEEFSRVMARAFADYPVMRRAFADAPGDRRDWIARMVASSLECRLPYGAPSLMARLDGQIVGAANVILPGGDVPKEAFAWFDGFLREAGPAAEDFFPRFIEAVEAVRLPKPHSYLVMIGVEPGFQGRGVGKGLIERIAELSAASPDCAGIGLDTEDEDNVRIYERCGFEVFARTSVDDLPVWTMWRPL